MAPALAHLAQCKKIIEAKLGWGASDTWQTGDFDNLSDQIFKDTNMLLSSSTLKRIWGKVRYESAPNLTTLNTLAQFAGYENWRQFVQCQTNGIKSSTITKSVNRNLPRHLLIGAAGIVILLFLSWLTLGTRPTKHLAFEGLEFESRLVARGVPNTVLFHYKASASNADSVFIQQSWDRNKRFRVDKQSQVYASTYYYPGYYQAKLVLNDSVVKEQDVLIETNGWLGYVEKKPVPVYLPQGGFKNYLGATKEQLQHLGIDFSGMPPTFVLSRVDSTMTHDGDNFKFTATLRNTFNERTGICQQTGILLLGTRGVIGLPLCNVGCIGEAGLLLGNKYLDGQTNDLSGFGVDFSKSVTVECTNDKNQIKIMVERKLAYAGAPLASIGKLIGIQFKFAGCGVVDSLRLR